MGEFWLGKIAPLIESRESVPTSGDSISASTVMGIVTNFFPATPAGKVTVAVAKVYSVLLVLRSAIETLANATPVPPPHPSVS